MNPMTVLPALSRCSLMRLTILAKMGVEALVPPLVKKEPRQKPAILSPLNPKVSIVY